LLIAKAGKRVNGTVHLVQGGLKLDIQTGTDNPCFGKQLGGLWWNTNKGIELRDEKYQITVANWN